MVEGINSKKIILSLLISLLVVQLSFPAYAPARSSYYIDFLPAVPDYRLLLDYDRVGVRSVSPDVIDPASAILAVRSSGAVNVTRISDTTTWNIYPFYQSMVLGFVIADAVRIGAPLDVNGHSNFTIFTPDGTTSFTGRIVGTANYQSGGGWMEMSLRFTGSASNGMFISLAIQGTLVRIGATPDGKYPVFEMNLEATGIILSLTYGTDNRPDY